MKINFIPLLKKYKLYFFLAFAFLISFPIGYLLFQHLKTKTEKKAAHKLYSLQEPLNQKIEKIKNEKEDKDQEKKPQTAFQELLKKKKNPINQRDLKEKLKVEIEDYKAFISQNSEKKAAFLAALELGALYTEAKDFESVKNLFLPLVKNLSAIKGGPIEGLFLTLLGTSLMELKDWKEALYYFNKILKNIKNEYLFPNTLLKIALCYEKLENKDQAILHYKKLIKDFPKSYLTTYGRSYLNSLFLKDSLSKKVSQKNPEKIEKVHKTKFKKPKFKKQ